MIALLAASAALAGRSSIAGEILDRNGAPVSRAVVSLAPLPGDRPEPPAAVELVTDREGRFLVDYLRDDGGGRVRLRKKVDYTLEVFKPGYHVYTARLTYRKGELRVDPVTMIEETLEVSDFPENLDPALYGHPTQASGATYEGQ